MNASARLGFATFLKALEKIRLAANRGSNESRVRLTVDSSGGRLALRTVAPGEKKLPANKRKRSGYSLPCPIIGK